MRIEYNLEPEDWADFGEYCMRQSAVYRRVVRNSWMGGVLALLLLCAAPALAAMKLPSASIAAVCGAAGAVVGGVWGRPQRVIANVRKSMVERQPPCLRGLHIMEALPEGLHSTCEVTESTIRWAGIRNVTQTDDHLFLMLGESQGFIIPKGRIVQGNLDRFLEDVARYRS